MDKSSTVSDGTPGPGRSGNLYERRRSRTPEPSLTPSTTTTGSQNSRQSSENNSVGPSPLASREASRDSSPIRQPRRASSTNRLVGPRKNSQTDQSPSRRTRPSIPSSSASSRSLSSMTTPTLLPTSQDQHQIQAPTPQKPGFNVDLRDNPRWPISPRLQSPPPQYATRPGIPARRSDQDLPSISVQRPSPSPQPPMEPRQSTPDNEPDETQSASGVRTPVRGPLETVQEVSLPNSPNPPNQPSSSSLAEQLKEELPSSDNYSDPALLDHRTLRARPILAAHESGSESSHKVARRRTTSVPPPVIARQSSALSAKQIKSKQDGLVQSMTVETETVPSVPQVALATGPKTEVNGPLKTKQSTETIKPKREKKKTSRKQPAVNAANGKPATSLRTSDNALTST